MVDFMQRFRLWLQGQVMGMGRLIAVVKEVEGVVPHHRKSDHPY